MTRVHTPIFHVAVLTACRSELWSASSSSTAIKFSHLRGVQLLPLPPKLLLHGRRVEVFQIAAIMAVSLRPEHGTSWYCHTVMHCHTFHGRLKLWDQQTLRFQPPSSITFAVIWTTRLIAIAPPIILLVPPVISPILLPAIPAVLTSVVSAVTPTIVVTI